MLAARVEPKNGPQENGNASRCSKYRRTISSKAPTPLASLDQNTISSTTLKRQSDTPSRLITIPGTSDHHHPEFVITIVWND